MRGIAIGALMLATAAFPGLASAQGDAPLSGVLIVVPTAHGKPGSGNKALTIAIRQTIEEAVGSLVPAKKIADARKRLKQGEKTKWSTGGLTAAGREAGADFVLAVEIIKEKWLYTAQSRLIRVEGGIVEMTFRSQYFKPEEEASDRGRRIGSRTLRRLEELFAAQEAKRASESPPREEPPTPGTAKKAKPESEIRLDGAPRAEPNRDTLLAPRVSPQVRTGAAPTSVGIEIETKPPSTELVRMSLVAGAELLRSYVLSSSAVTESRLSYHLSPLAMISAKAEIKVPDLPLGLAMRGSFRPVRFAVTIQGEGGSQQSPTTPAGRIYDVESIVQLPINLSSTESGAYRLVPGAGVRFSALNVDRHRGDIIVSHRALAPEASLLLRLPFTASFELDADARGGPIVSYVETPGKSGTRIKGAFTLSTELEGWIWLSRAIAVTVGARFDIERVAFEGMPSRFQPASENLSNAATLTRDLRTGVGVAFRL